MDRMPTPETLTKTALVSYLNGLRPAHLNRVFWNDQPMSVERALSRAQGISDSAVIARWKNFLTVREN